MGGQNHKGEGPPHCPTRPKPGQKLWILPDGFNRGIEVGQANCHVSGVTNREAYVLRENTGTSGVVQTARDAVAVLAHFEIPHLIVGGIAVQEYGYPRVTIDVDIIVPDVLEAVEFLTSGLSGPFVRVSGRQEGVEDRRNGVVVDLLPAGHVVKTGNKVPLPQPTIASENLQLVTLEELVSLKLDSWSGSPLRRHRDRTDVVELIVRRKLPRDLAVAAAVQQIYLDTWDGLKAES